ncbi:endonuclease/exonuclease/phosphatase family protein [Streptomyces xiamenensis]|uniref:endonuclease/exonuclease/phosphatase family protein n=1 Tax=Streptomyces xiamenensis TaxID=408015 RepID=UPI000628812F|nr:endonuclease/exonuclease/phosphatase family protein [Streptomyces xiamenensis]
MNHTSPSAPPRRASRPRTWTRGPVLTALALLLGLFLLLHSWIPDRPGGLGSLVETFLPWFGLFVPVLLAGALWRRSAPAVIALLLPALVWLNLFGGLLGDRSRATGAEEGLTVVSHNVDADNSDPAATARELAASGADILALQELTEQARAGYEQELASGYPYHEVRGTVGLWSRLPLSDTETVDIGMLPARALRTTVATDRGPLALYVAHLGSVRVVPGSGFRTGTRDVGARALGEAVTAEGIERVVLLGDLNGTMDDRAFGALTEQLDSAQEQAGAGFGFSWPARFPVVRPDQILVRGVETSSAWVLPATASDHRPVAAHVVW